MIAADDDRQAEQKHQLDEEFTGAGRVGVWTKAESAGNSHDLRVEDYNE